LIVVADTSPILNLALIDQLDLLLTFQAGADRARSASNLTRSDIGPPLVDPAACLG
jgi:hypothetical protein